MQGLIDQRVFPASKNPETIVTGMPILSPFYHLPISLL
ncbi:hypothetical protein P790_1262 [Enterococcus faecalis NJ44]|nr:hypothetical protein P790_1262 [Enterococcus faecalis NJ44]